MALPPKGHPDRPLFSAASSMMFLGILCLLLATCAGVGVFGLGGGMAGGLGRLLMLVGVLVFYLTPGVGFIICSVYLKRYRAWAATVGIVLTSLALLGFAMALLSSTFTLLAQEEADGFAWAVPLVCLLFIVAFAQLIYLLARSYTPIRIHETEGPQGYGFQPLDVQPISPPPPPFEPMEPRDTP